MTGRRIALAIFVQNVGRSITQRDSLEVERVGV